MYKIGEIEGNPVMRNESIKDKGVKESINDEQLIKLISESQEYKTTRDENVINNLFEVITWYNWRIVNNIPYKIKLKRVYLVERVSGYNRKTGNWEGSVKIEESEFHTRFVIEFESCYKELPNYYNEVLSPIGGGHFPTSGDNQKDLDKKVTDMIFHIQGVVAQQYFKQIDSKINTLKDEKQKCQKMFNVLQDVY